MSETLELILRILGLIIATAGMIVVYAAPKIVAKKGLAEKKQIPPEHLEKMSEEEQKKFRLDSAILDVKLKGLMLAAPGLVLILIAFRK